MQRADWLRENSIVAYHSLLELADHRLFHSLDLILLNCEFKRVTKISETKFI